MRQSTSRGCLLQVGQPLPPLLRLVVDLYSLFLQLTDMARRAVRLRQHSFLFMLATALPFRPSDSFRHLLKD